MHLQIKGYTHGLYKLNIDSSSQEHSESSVHNIFTKLTFRMNTNTYRPLSVAKYSLLSKDFKCLGLCEIF